MRSTAEIINYYDEFTVQEMITDAVKHDRMKRRNRSRRKTRQLKQKFILKFLALTLILGGFTIIFISPIDGSAAIACIAIGLLGLIVPYNATLT